MRHAFIYLASQSPRRRELLAQLGVRFELLLADANEDVESLEERSGRETPRHYVQRVTALKAGAALIRLKRTKQMKAPILSADTTVAIGSRIFGKPASRDEAADFLAQFSGRSHWVFTAVAVAHNSKLDLMVSASRVTMKQLGRAEINSYLSCDEYQGKAGGYAIQGRAAAFVTEIRGSHSGIVGLPLAETAQLLRQYRVDF